MRILSLLLIFVVTACSPPVAKSGGQRETTTTSTTSSTTTTSIPVYDGPPYELPKIEPPTISPLNGLEIEAELLDRRVLAVKIDNHANARPQSGIEQADAVYELLVEAGLTRFLPLFHSSDAEYLGPMRSGRPTDPTLLLPLGATFAISGAQDWVINRIASFGVPMIGEIRPATFRISSRRAPHNLYVNTTALRRYADGHGYPDLPPPPLFRWGSLRSTSESAEIITLDWSPEQTVEWTWNGTRYERSIFGSPHTYLNPEGEPEPIVADSLVVLFAPKYTAVPPRSGTAVPAMDTTGEGRAIVFSGGRVLECRWTRDNTEDMFDLRMTDGAPVAVPPGIPWISVFPDHRSVTWSVP